ncbi:hypothetical protein PYH37_005243 [Sinorhizobium numidicum]|uniref:Uncharacterized protein n=1 Tax=Sinorhizobium numidicum TaxID=680248 RepID=A0ABY8CY27_9HYPH|nr:hypothetical protein [Sinorhizobium numidicum]WEX76892.1 hypothetical protein PYH37_005243 [Sinorhizobium numidicum]WEX83551.1 hypothetical protein PYH38_002336 [Sinorhizobium numidicum]
MSWVEFKRDFNWVQPGFTIAYKAGMTLNVTRACADEAQAKGVAVKLPKPKREKADGQEA